VAFYPIAGLQIRSAGPHLTRGPAAAPSSPAVPGHSMKLLPGSLMLP